MPRRSSYARARHPALSHAPNLGRFLSADTVAPGSAALTVWPSDGVAAALWATGGDGPLNPQALNRYSYVENNPVRYTDPSGHIIDECQCGGGRMSPLTNTERLGPG
ncbi:MAG: hypothetical protein MI924_04585, partial [Chloroflexales bacterium]|nr:hypothetical protein [Chloroflexales bacterium]